MASDDDEYRKANLLSRAEWHPDTVARLIDGYGEKCANIKGYLKTKDWEEIVKYVNIQCEGSKVPKTMKQCREKIDSLKRRYKLEKRRVEIRGSNHVNWSFFDKLDDIMRNLRRSGNISEGHSFEVAEALDFEGFEGDSRSDLMISNNKGKASCIENSSDVFLDDGMHTDGNNIHNNINRTSSRRVRVELQDSKGKRQAAGAPDRMSKRSCLNPNPSPHGSLSPNPVRALADALVSFSEIYSRIESAKMELFTKMNLELAKLHKKKKKNPSSSSMNCAESDKCRASQ
ncbi:trihelix transcription factor ENAP1 [Cryptomeria japonica]|uniref:trihelix transcription factor ENAP1 n=1 Tax=Cryptomeria japonica TaxID=3369 RepID=UPI0025ACD146|nr:trihelix transcription factor ENAP1 [Cryptomeria japonica]